MFLLTIKVPITYYTYYYYSYTLNYEVAPSRIPEKKKKDVDDHPKNSEAFI